MADAPGRRARPGGGAPAAGRRHRALRWSLLGALALAPAIFTRSTVESFEFPKVELWITVALFFAAYWIAAEGTRAAGEGAGRWLAGMPGRLVRSARRDPIGSAVGLFLISAVASTIASIHPGVSLHGAPDSFAGLTTGFATASVYFASRALAAEPRWLARVAGAAAFGSAVSSGYALLQLAGLDPLGWDRTASLGGAVRIFGTLGHPNLLGAYLVTSLPLVAWRASSASSWAVRALFTLVAAASLAAIVATLSRGAWIALGLSVAAWVALRWRAMASEPRSAGSKDAGRARAARAAGPRTWRLCALGMLAFGALSIPVAGALGPSLVQRLREIGSLASPTAQSRLEIWRAGIRMAEDHPAFGAGLDGFSAAFPKYRRPEYWRIEWGGTPAKAHNELVQIAATQGGFGLIAALMVLALVARATWRSSVAGGPFVRDGATFAGAALAGFAGQDLASFTTVATGTLAAAMAGWAASSAGGHADGADADAAPSSSLRLPAHFAPGAWVAGILLAGVAFIPFVLSPWRAERAAHDALAAPVWSRERIEGLRRAEGIAPWNPTYPSRLGTALLLLAHSSKDPEERWTLLSRAYSSYERALHLAPHLASERAGLGRTLAMQSQLRPELIPMDRAREAFDEARLRDPANALVLLQEEDMNMELGRYGDARGAALRIAALYPEYARPFADLGLMALHDGRYEDAVDTLLLAVSKDFHADSTSAANAWSNLSGAYIDLGRYEEALRPADRALEISRTHPAAEKNRATAMRALGRTP